MSLIAVAVIVSKLAKCVLHGFRRFRHFAAKRGAAAALDEFAHHGLQRMNSVDETPEEHKAHIYEHWERLTDTMLKAHMVSSRPVEHWEHWNLFQLFGHLVVKFLP